MLRPLLPYLPKALGSRWAGQIARQAWSRALIPAFVRHYGVNLNEAEHPIEQYATLQAFFCRRLKAGVRPIYLSPGVVVAPCDGTVGACGVIENGLLLQAKGHTYGLAELLADAARVGEFVGGSYATIYLAPHDYHRVHAPIRGEVARARYIPGTYWPVNAAAVEAIPELFARNERLVTYIAGEEGQLAVVQVGACLVGGIRVNYDPRWNAGPGPHAGAEREYEPAMGFECGEEMARFEFGSTVIVLAPAGFELCVKVGDGIKMGEPLLQRG